MENIIKAQMEFTDGKIINLELYPDYAPITVANFVSLCDAHFYDGLCFHRVIDKFMIQGGGFVYDNNRGLLPKETRSIKGEFTANGVKNPLKHTVGTISMARTQVPDSASSQFFICVADTPFLDGQYAAFGRCADEESIKNAIALGKAKTGRWSYYENVPFDPIVIKTLRIVK